MENASKALIIAGAILLSILIIGLGVFIYNQSKNSIGETGMDQLAIQTFNAKFEPYEGRQSGKQATELLKTILSNNYTYADDDSMKVKINFARSSGEIEIYDANVSYTGGNSFSIEGIEEKLYLYSAEDFYIVFVTNPKNGMIKEMNLSRYRNQSAPR